MINFETLETAQLAGYCHHAVNTLLSPAIQRGVRIAADGAATLPKTRASKDVNLSLWLLGLGSYQFDCKLEGELAGLLTQLQLPVRAWLQVWHPHRCTDNLSSPDRFLLEADFVRTKDRQALIAVAEFFARLGPKYFVWHMKHRPYRYVGCND